MLCFIIFSRKYDKAEHEPPVEMEQLNQAAAAQKETAMGDDSVKSMDLKGRNLWAVISLEQMCWGDVGLFLARPGTGLGNAAISAVGNPDYPPHLWPRCQDLFLAEPRIILHRPNTFAPMKLLPRDFCPLDPWI